MTILKNENIKINMLFSIQAFFILPDFIKVLVKRSFSSKYYYPTCEVIYTDNNVVEEAFVAIIANRFLDMCIVVNCYYW